MRTKTGDGPLKEEEPLPHEHESQDSEPFEDEELLPFEDKGRDCKM